jgi:hypothetical protein
VKELEDAVRKLRLSCENMQSLLGKIGEEINTERNESESAEEALMKAAEKLKIAVKKLEESYAKT